MIGLMRKKFGPYIVGGIIGLIAFVFIFYGVFTPGGASDGAGAYVGKVNGDSITASEFSRQVNRRLEAFRSYGMKEEQLKAFGIHEMVFRELVNRRLIIQDADRQGLAPSASELRDRISELPYFQKDGKFSVELYRETLKANNFTPAAFENQIAEDLKAQIWQEKLGQGVMVSDEEAKQEHLATQNQRKFQWVSITPESMMKQIAVSPKAVAEYLALPANFNLVKSRFEAQKERVYKDKKFEAVQNEIAREILISDKAGDAQKLGEALAQKVLVAWRANIKGSEVSRILKPYGLELKTTDWVNARTAFLPGVGEVPELMSDAFNSKEDRLNSPQIYKTARGVLIAKIAESKKPDSKPLDFEAQTKLKKQLLATKLSEIQESALRALAKTAKITRNEAYLADSGAAGGVPPRPEN